ncbi:MAG: YggS family pyridoxal phosphate-dependent enzyme [Vicinamibacteria bacterium]|nr:YggS family pyridoxal phosphate-dependent enzyme [Vicinamibacteria bacterium]
MVIADRIAAIRERMAAAALRAGRESKGVALVAVSKFQPASALEAAYAAGQRLFGENRVQEAEEKKRLLGSLLQGEDALRLELIGALQSNKVRKAVAAVSRIQSIDSVELAARVGRAAQEIGLTMPVLIQVDLAGEPAKSGVPERDLLSALQVLRAAEGISLDGLMAIPPFFDNPDDVRPYFARLRALKDQGMERGLLVRGELSMGMSHDFEAAIEEGATIVRIGTAIFGERPPRETA